MWDPSLVSVSLDFFFFWWRAEIISIYTLYSEWVVNSSLRKFLKVPQTERWGQLEEHCQSQHGAQACLAPVGLGGSCGLWAPLLTALDAKLGVWGYWAGAALSQIKCQSQLDSHWHADHICAPGCRDLIVIGYGHMRDAGPYIAGSPQLRLLALPRYSGTNSVPSEPKVGKEHLGWPGFLDTLMLF